MRRDQYQDKQSVDMSQSNVTYHPGQFSVQNLGLLGDIGLK